MLSGVLAANPTRTRYDVATNEGLDMLRTYAGAVRDMKALPGSDPRSWTFQWYTHWVAGNQDKLLELNKYFGAAPSPARDLANIVWSSCQAHGGGMTQSNFLPWHRAYVACFEDIVRSVSGRADFTLPYWDYVKSPVLPEPFRSPNDPDFGPLYVADRYEEVNNGGTLGDLPGAPPLENLINLDSMLEASFTQSTLGLGLSAKLDNELHGTIHGLVGTPTNMGRVPFAAKDPIFWLHHCNIDRIWAGWSKLGGVNPTDTQWLAAAHVFVDSLGARVVIKNGEVGQTAQLDYAYDALPDPGGANLDVAMDQASSVQSVARSGPVPLDQDGAIVSLSVTEQDAMPSIVTLGDGDHQLVLTISDLSSTGPVDTIFAVYAKSTASSAGDRGVYLGTINFFDARIGDSQAVGNKQFAFRLSSAAANADVLPGSVDALTYTIVPIRPLDPAAKPMIGRIELLQENRTGTTS